VSSYEENQVGVLVRQRLGLPPSAALGFLPLIPAAILRTIEKAAARADLRPYTLTDPSTTTATLDANGVADLTTLITTPGILLNCVKYGDITHPDYPQPLRFLNGGIAHGQFAGALDGLFPKCWLENNDLHTRVATEAALAGDLSLAVPYQQTLAQINDILIHAEGIGVVDSLIDLLQLRPDEEDGD
jgi:hypothetical protein